MKTLLLAIGVLFLAGCGGATVGLNNQSSFSVKDITIGSIPVPGTVSPGSSSIQVKVDTEGSYNAVLYALSGSTWYRWTSYKTIEVKKGGLFGGDKANIFVLYNSDTGVFGAPGQKEEKNIPLSAVPIKVSQ